MLHDNNHVVDVALALFHRVMKCLSAWLVMFNLSCSSKHTRVQQTKYMMEKKMREKTLNISLAVLAHSY